MDIYDCFENIALKEEVKKLHESLSTENADTKEVFEKFLTYILNRMDGNCEERFSKFMLGIIFRDTENHVHEYIKEFTTRFFMHEIQLKKITYTVGTDEITCDYYKNLEES